MIGTNKVEQEDGPQTASAGPACSLCGVIAESRGDGVPPLGWSADLIETSEGTRPRWVCVGCTRRFVRSIEAKLDHEWW